MRALFRRGGTPANEKPAPAGPWARHSARADELCERYPHAAEVLLFYRELVAVWDVGRRAADRDRPEPADLAAWTARSPVIDAMVGVTTTAGPQSLVVAARTLRTRDRDTVASMLTAWLAGQELVPMEQFFARVALRGPVHALGADAVWPTADPAEDTPDGSTPGHRCPTCGGPAQLSCRGDSGDPLVTGPRVLLCARCCHTWPFSANSCAACGRTIGAKKAVHTEKRDRVSVGRISPGAVTFPHIRVESCGSCRRYLVDVDNGVDSHAVAEVDELAALPYDLHATQRGLRKTTPNLMGF